MRLLRLDFEKRRWILEDFTGPTVPFYAVLSHTWGRDNDEVKFEDVANGQRDFNDTSKPGFEKLRFCQERAEQDGLRYFWVDTCCIKKSSSSELQLSINSMFFWYQRAVRCYVWLSDVSIQDADGEADVTWEKAFSKSRWFKRGWTLQELVAPKSVFFFSKEQNFLGDREGLASTISTITRVPGPALEGVQLSRFSVEERLSWAKGRVTTVPEDMAYSLVGILEVDLPWMYAEGEFDKRKNAALEQLHKAIAEKKRGDRPEGVIRIGGASWVDLTTLSKEQLQLLDDDLDQFQDWVLDGFPRLYRRQFGNPESLTELSEAAGKRMKALLARYGVRYEDLSNLGSGMQSWKEPWSVYRSRDYTAQARVQGLVGNRWYWTKKTEDVFTGITAFRTFEDLMIWRGRWK